MTQTKAQLISGSSDQSVTFNNVSVSSLNNGPLSGTRNRIINGDMRIDQRNAGASVTPATGNYTLDRWFFGLDQASKLTTQQNAGSVTPPAGFTNYLGVTSSSAYTVGASESFSVRQNIEGFNVSDLGFGTASAQSITLSFWARSSLTGTFGGTLSNSAQDRFYVFSYAISAANTWEYKTVTIAGDTSGTWLTNNGIGIRLLFSLGSGATVSGAAGSWGSTLYRSATGATSVVGTNGATFYITGVQLESGSVATPFERRSYGQELSLCQRYYQGNANSACIGTAQTTLYLPYVATYFATMRAVPTATFVSGSLTSQNSDFFNVTYVGATGMSVQSTTTNSFMGYLTGGTWTKTGGTSNFPANTFASGIGSLSVNVSAEL